MCNKVETLYVRICVCEWLFTQVMITKNLSKVVVNGSRGVVTGFEVDPELSVMPLPVVELVDGTRLLLKHEQWDSTLVGGKRRVSAVVLYVRY